MKSVLVYHWACRDLLGVSRKGSRCLGMKAKSSLGLCVHLESSGLVVQAKCSSILSGMWRFSSC